MRCNEGPCYWDLCCQGSFCEHLCSAGPVILWADLAIRRAGIEEQDETAHMSLDNVQVADRMQPMMVGHAGCGGDMEMSRFHSQSK